MNAATIAVPCARKKHCSHGRQKNSPRNTRRRPEWLRKHTMDVQTAYHNFGAAARAPLCTAIRLASFSSAAPLLLPRHQFSSPQLFGCVSFPHPASNPFTPKQAENLPRPLLFSDNSLPSGMGHFWFVSFCQPQIGAHLVKVDRVRFSFILHQNGRDVVELEAFPFSPFVAHESGHPPAVSLAALGTKLNSSVPSSLSTSMSFCWHNSCS